MKSETHKNTSHLPCSIESEQAVICGLLLSNEVWEQVSGIVSENDFFLPSHVTIYSAIASLSSKNKPFDLLTLPETLKATNALDKSGGEAYLFELAGRIPSVANIETYAETVRMCSLRRQAVMMADEVKRIALDMTVDNSELVMKIGSQFEMFSQRERLKNEPIKIGEIFRHEFKEMVDASTSNCKGLLTGFKDFDHLTSGLQRGELILLAARPSMGKTTLAMNIVENVISRDNASVLVFSIEMTRGQVAKRIMSSLGSVNQHRLRVVNLSNSDWESIGEVVSRMAHSNLYIDDSPSATVNELKSKAKRLLRNTGRLDMIVIDYLQMIHEPTYKRDRVQEITAISRGLKGLAKELNVPVLALSQLNRALESRSDKIPVMSDLRDSGALEQDADLIAFIYRDEQYNPGTIAKGVAEVIISKQRNGPVGTINLRFLGEYTRFENISNF